MPLGTEIITLMPLCVSIAFAESKTICSIIFFGTGLIAARPISNPSPGRVTRPTPSPPSISTRPFSVVKDTVEHISAPCVTSGSSPASFITALVTDCVLGEYLVHAIFSFTILPFGRAISIVLYIWDEISANNAALVAAVAEEPVVNPVLKSPFLRFSMISNDKLCLLLRFLPI